MRRTTAREMHSISDFIMFIPTNWILWSNSKIPRLKIYPHYFSTNYFPCALEDQKNRCKKINRIKSDDDENKNDLCSVQ